MLLASVFVCSGPCLSETSFVIPTVCVWSFIIARSDIPPSGQSDLFPRCITHALVAFALLQIRVHIRPSYLSCGYNSYPPAMNDSPISPSTAAKNGFAPRSPQSPKTPRLSAPPSPVTPRQSTAHRGSEDFSAAQGGGGGGGLGNLADELADAWEQEEEGYGYASGQENGRTGSLQGHSDGEDAYLQSVRDMCTRSPSAGLSPERAARSKHRSAHLRQHRRQESYYDGSDYGNESDLDETSDISPGLDSQMASIDSLARRGIENNGSDNDLVIQRTVEALRDLGGQSGIENSAMRSVHHVTPLQNHTLIRLADLSRRTPRLHRISPIKPARSSPSSTHSSSLHSHYSPKTPLTHSCP